MHARSLSYASIVHVQGVNIFRGRADVHTDRLADGIIRLCMVDPGAIHLKGRPGNQGLGNHNLYPVGTSILNVSVLVCYTPRVK